MSRALFQLAAAALLVGACGRIGFAPVPDGGADGACTLGPWGNVQWQTALGSPSDDWEPALSRDGLVLAFGSTRDSAVTHMFVATRASPADAFGDVRAVTELTAGPTIPELVGTWSRDGTHLYYSSGSAAMSAPHLGGGQFGTPVPVDLPAGHSWVLTTDELEVFYSHDVTPGDVDLRHATRPSIGAPWTVLSDVDAMNRPGLEDGWPGFDEPSQVLYVEQQVPTGAEIKVATRTGPGAPFGPLATLDLGGDAGDPDISRDGRTLTFSSARVGGAGAYDVYIATRGCE